MRAAPDFHRQDQMPAPTPSRNLTQVAPRPARAAAPTETRNPVRARADERLPFAEDEHDGQQRDR
ncbi:hypothetical protein TV39_12100 [Arthrobacter sp. SPG23]|nr:hypothetical protein TV39_12100 [Arthrobacter sp. SPG23]